MSLVFMLLLLWFLCLLSVFWIASANKLPSLSTILKQILLWQLMKLGECGLLYLAKPLDACSNLSNKVEKVWNVTFPFALVIRGGCSFEEKVRRVQEAGFKASIVYDNDDGVLVSMAGNVAGININAIFVSKASGEMLKRHRIRRECPQSSRVRGFHGMSGHLVKAMPSLIFTDVLEDNCTSTTCAICLEDYTMGEKLRILACFHSKLLTTLR